jgi:hypothetical protein
VEADLLKAEHGLGVIGPFRQREIASLQSSLQSLKERQVAVELHPTISAGGADPKRLLVQIAVDIADTQAALDRAWFRSAAREPYRAHFEAQRTTLTKERDHLKGKLKGLEVAEHQLYFEKAKDSTLQVASKSLDKVARAVASYAASAEGANRKVGWLDWSGWRARRAARRAAKDALEVVEGFAGKEGVERLRAAPAAYQADVHETLDEISRFYKESRPKN